MTKFETILKLAEIKGMMRLESPDASMGSISAYGEICELIHDLQDDDDDDIQCAHCHDLGYHCQFHRCKCHGCGKFHE